MKDKTQDGSRGGNEQINISDEGALRHWTRELRVDERTLKAAYYEAGPSIAAFRQSPLVRWASRRWDSN